MSAQDDFKSLVESLGKLLKVQGFRSKGPRFVLRSEKCLGLIEFQKSGSNTKDLVKFCVNCGVYLKELAFMVSGLSEEQLRPTACQFEWRVCVPPATDETWWTLQSDRSYSAVEEEVKDRLTVDAVPSIQRLMDLEKRVPEWADLATKAKGAPDILEVLVALLAARGEVGQLPAVIAGIQKIVANEEDAGSLSLRRAMDRLAERFGTVQTLWRSASH